MGRRQLLGRRSTGRAARRTRINTAFNPQLGSDLNAIYQPAAAAQLQDRREPRSKLLQRARTRQIADLQLQQRITQTGRNVRAAYYSLVGAIAGLEVAQESLDVARTSLKNNQTRVEVGTMAPIDISTARGGSREQRGER